MHAYVGVLRDHDDGVIGTLNERSTKSCLSNVAVRHRKLLGLAVGLQDEVRAYFQPVPPIWPQGARFCAGNGVGVKSALAWGESGAIAPRVDPSRPAVTRHCSGKEKGP